MPKGRWPTAATIASQQHGLITRRQLRDIGIGDRAISQRIQRRTLEVLHPAVYRIPGVPPSWEQSLLAAQLGAGEPSYVSHLAAAMVWGLEGVTTDRPHILLPHARRIDLSRVVIHRTRVLPMGDVRSRNGLRITAPARTIVDTAAALTRIEVEIAVDDALRRRIVTLAQIEDCLAGRGPQGVKGWGKVRGVVDERLGTEPTGSGKETIFLSGLRDRGLPMPVNQYRIIDGRGREVARPDFSYPDLKIAIEIDSGFHHNPRQRRRDIRRQNAMSALGWRCLYFDRTDPLGQAEAFATIETAFGEERGTTRSQELPKGVGRSAPQDVWGA